MGGGERKRSESPRTGLCVVCEGQACASAVPRLRGPRWISSSTELPGPDTDGDNAVDYCCWRSIRTTNVSVSESAGEIAFIAKG